jgi:hypothetical protein
MNKNTQNTNKHGTFVPEFWSEFGAVTILLLMVPLAQVNASNQCDC